MRKLLVNIHENFSEFFFTNTDQLRSYGTGETQDQLTRTSYEGSRSNLGRTITLSVIFIHSKTFRHQVGFFCKETCTQQSVMVLQTPLPPLLLLVSESILLFILTSCSLKLQSNSISFLHICFVWASTLFFTLSTKVSQSENISL